MATNTFTYKLNHAMIRVKDPERSLKFYEFLGMTIVFRVDFEAYRMSLIFLAFDGAESPQKGNHWSDREGVLELMHNWGTQDDANFSVADGNSEAGKGFGHVCISVDNIQAACGRLEEKGYKFQKKLTEGRIRDIAFALDPDGYWVEIISQADTERNKDISATDMATYKMNHAMLRVKDSEKSLKFYQEVLGMNLIHTVENPEFKFNSYFLSYKHENVEQNDREGVLELTWNYGTELNPDFKYHDGNSEPFGFGHLCISVDDYEAACDRFDRMEVVWRKRPLEGNMRGIAAIADPDGYSIEILQNQAIKAQHQPVML